MKVRNRFPSYQKLYLTSRIHSEGGLVGREMSVLPHLVYHLQRLNQVKEALLLHRRRKEESTKTGMEHKGDNWMKFILKLQKRTLNI